MNKNRLTEEEQLLLIDLCARVPYQPKGHVVNACNGAQCDEWLTYATFPMFTSFTNNCRLYLRPMSSMTEEEKKRYDDILTKMYYHEKSTLGDISDYLNSIHVDYRGLIEKGLAIEAPEGMYS